jgi:signal transduction histidine kinase/ligand-binding sensor domain-containing protein
VAGRSCREYRQRDCGSHSIVFGPDASRGRGKIVESSVHAYSSTRTGTNSVGTPREMRCVSFPRKAQLLNNPLSRYCFLLFFLAATAWAVDPHTRISQYGHTAWRTQDSFVTNPHQITQTTDGYIWIGMASGLTRFDGVKFTAWTAPKGQSLPRKGLTDLLGAKDGSLWIGTGGGLSHLENGQLFNYTPKPGSPGISAIMEDHTGTIWVTRYRINDGMGPLCRVTGKTLQCYGEKDGIPVKYGLGLAEDSEGNIWFGSNVLCRWAPGSSSVYFEQELKHTAGYGVVGVATGTSGSVWASLDGTGPKLGVRYYSKGKWASFVVPGFDGATIRSEALYVDRNHSLWVGTESQGLYRIRDGVADHYGSANGLSGNNVTAIYEDRESNLWVATDRGLDLFRDNPVVTFSTNEGLIGSNIHSILALKNGSVWVGNEQALDVIDAGGISAIATGHGLPGQNVGAMFEDSTGRIWLGIDDTVMTYKLGRFFEVRKADGRPLIHIGGAEAFAEDVEGNIWVVAHINVPGQRRLLRIKGQRLEEEIPLDDLIPTAHFLAADRDAGIWVGSERGKLVRYRNGKAEGLISLGNGENSVVIYSLSVDSDNAVWAATNEGLYRWKDGRLSVMDLHDGLPCSHFYSAIEDNYGSFWLYAKCGLLKISASDWATWLKSPDSKVSAKVFDVLDGAQPQTGNVDQPVASKSPDGRLWFASGSFVQMVDPARTYTNVILPPVHIEELVADHKIYNTAAQLRLPPLKNGLEISYTALSFTLPQKVAFRYKLEGHDTEWQESGTRRQAFYNDLRPGRYRFRVIACNSSGVWNEEGASMDFSIAPAWFQTIWFRALCAASVFLIVWAIYQLRVRQVARAIGARFDERLAERTRIARELHDTFLQTIQGSKLVADDALDTSTDLVRMRRAMEQLSVWLGRATDEGRAALNSLRTSATEKNDLAEAFRRAMDECHMQSSMEGSLSVVGDANEMHPIVRDEVYRIGYEAIRNACVHSQASQLRVELTYAEDLSLCVSDNGVGMGPAVADHGKDEHFGLRGMRERAERIVAKLTLVSSAASGTKIKLVVPGSIIYRETPSNRRKLPARIEAVLKRLGLTSNPD